MSIGTDLIKGEGGNMLSVQHFFDEVTHTLTYIVYDKVTSDAIVMDPVWNYNQASSCLNTICVDNVEKFINSNRLKLHFILETHAHADHLTGAVELRKRFPDAKVGIGKHITKVQETFKEIFNFKDFNTSGVQFDILLDESKLLKAGSIEIKTIFTPGHTPACSSYLIEDMVFTGDALFMPDSGTGRCDFPLGSAKNLYNSIHEKLYKLPDSTKVYTCHDYQPDGRELKFVTTIGESKESNIQLNQKTTEEEYVRFRTERDKKLSAPKLLLPSIQVNIDGGNLPLAEDNEVSYLKIPVRNK